MLVFKVPLSEYASGDKAEFELLSDVELTTDDWFWLRFVLGTRELLTGDDI